MLNTLTNLFHNNTVFIIGGGASLSGFDFSLLDDKLTLAINSAYKQLPNATGILWTDQTFEDENYKQLIQHSAPCKFRTRIYSKPFQAEYWYNLPIYPTSFSESLTGVAGNNSGAYALNLVALTNPSKIILLGFDMTGRHFHDEYRHLNPHTIFRQSIEDMAPYIKIPVINTSPISTIKSFPYEPIINFL